MRLCFLGWITVSSLFGGTFFWAQSTEDSLLLPKSWRLQQNLGQIHQEMLHIQYSMSHLNENNQKLHQILGTLNEKTGTIQLSQANKELSQALHSFLQETELLMEQYQKLAQRYQKLVPSLQQFRQELEKEQQKNEQLIRQLRQEMLTLQQRGQDLLVSYRQSPQLHIRTQLKQLFQLDQQHLQTKSLLLEQQKEKQKRLNSFAQQSKEMETVSDQLCRSFPQIFQILQEEKQYVINVAQFQIGLLQNTAYVDQIQKSQDQLYHLEKTLSSQLDTYTQTREELEEKMFQLRQQLLEDTPPFFPKPHTLFSKKE